MAACRSSPLVRSLCMFALVMLASNVMQEGTFVAPRSPARVSPRVVLRAAEKPLETPEANVFVTEQIFKCLTEGCPVGELEALEGMLARDEARIEMALKKMEDDEAAGLLRSFVDHSRDLRQGLEDVKAIKDSFANHLAGAVPFGHGSTAGFIEPQTVDLKQSV